ncbi:meiosis-specific kinetochore protein [Erinaceus europaeus]|uniref:Meiosis-specific kinetochore protein n=1 Tax=Erinaceus europaeus TaxID=9365 RepID=A0ABM3X0M9_ERIEU|nr:meiosis-specific kinetochore protein [Erinaceus europaeus]
MAMWPRAYTRKKRFGQKLNLTPTLDLRLPAEVEVAPIPAAHRRPLRGGLHCGARGLKGRGALAGGLQKIREKAEQSGQASGASEAPSIQLKLTGEKSPHNTTSEETRDEDTAPLSESETDDLQVECSSLNSEVASGLSTKHDISSSLLCYSVTDTCATEQSADCNSFEESLSNFPSPELFRGSDYLDWGCSRLEEHVLCKNSTLLDTSKAIAVEKASQFSNLSAILGVTSEDYQKCQRQMSTRNTKGYHLGPQQGKARPTLGTYQTTEIEIKEKQREAEMPQNCPTIHATSPSAVVLPCGCGAQPKDFEQNTSTCEILLTGKTYPSTPEKTKKKNINFNIPDKKSRGLLTSTPSSKTSGLIIDLSSVQKASFEELVPNVSNYVNSDEIVTVSSLQGNSPNEVPSSPPELCCIIRASPGTRQMKTKRVVAKKKKYSPPKDFPEDIIIKTNGRTLQL